MDSLGRWWGVWCIYHKGITSERSGRRRAEVDLSFVINGVAVVCVEMRRRGRLWGLVLGHLGFRVLDLLGEEPWDRGGE